MAGSVLGLPVLWAWDESCKACGPGEGVQPTVAGRLAWLGNFEGGAWRGAAWPVTVEGRQERGCGRRSAGNERWLLSLLWPGVGLLEDGNLLNVGGLPSRRAAMAEPWKEEEVTAVDIEMALPAAAVSFCRGCDVAGTV